MHDMYCTCPRRVVVTNLGVGRTTQHNVEGVSTCVLDVDNDYTPIASAIV